MNIRKTDLNLLVYLNVLLEERSVSKAADKLAITQPAMSNALKRLRELFDDPILVRTADGMTPTDKAVKLKPDIVELLSLAEQITQPDRDFSIRHSEATFRVMASDYMEATLITPFIQHVLSDAPHINFDLLTPGDVSLHDMEKGSIDLAINRFTTLPKSFHQATVWRDNFCCLLHRDHPYVSQPDLDNYLAAEHIWVNRAGWGVESVASNKSGAQRLGWVDEALWQLDKTRSIRVFTRHYMMMGLLLQEPQLIATIPRRLARIYQDSEELAVCRVPFQIVPFEIKMIWSPLRQHSRAHQWLRRSLLEFSETVLDR